MFEVFGINIGLLLIIPLILLVQFLMNIFGVERGDDETIFKLIPLFFLSYYLFKFASLALTQEAWGFVGGEYQATAVQNNVTDSAELLLLEGVPVMATIIFLTTILRIGYNGLKESGSA